MKIDIKHKINCIRKGEIPEGYFKIGNNIIPDDWEMKKVKDVVISIVGGGTPSRSKSEYYGGNIPWATVKDLSEDNYKESTIEYITLEGLENSSSKLIEKENFIISTRMGLGRGFINKVPMAINQDLKGIYVNKELVDIRFFMYWFKSLKDYIDNLGNGSTVKGINLQTLRSLDFRLTSIEEQQNISEILSTWDKAIELKEKLIEEKKKQKTGLMQKLLTGKVRLSGFDKEWVNVKLKKILKQRNEKSEIKEGLELYSLTIEDGVTPKTDRYNREFLVKSGNKKYKITKCNDIVYNPANLRFGAIAVNRIGQSVLLSPIYEVLYIKDEKKYDIDFVGQLLTWDRNIKYFSTMAEGTLVERMAVKIDAFLDVAFKFPPSLEEQKAIASILSLADKEICILKKEVISLKKQKKGLMQLLLTGIVRVNTQES